MSPMEVRFLASGEKVTVLDPEKFKGKTAKAVKTVLVPFTRVSRFRQRLLRENVLTEIGDLEVFTEPSRVVMVLLDFKTLDSYEMQAMVEACQVGDVNSLESFLCLPADPNFSDESRWWNRVSPLHDAAGRGHLEISRLRMEAGADKDAMMRDSVYKTPLRCAVASDHVSVVQLLLQVRADVNLCNPLYEAAQNGYLRVARLLIANRAVVDQSVEGGETALMAAAYEGHLQLTRLLLAYRARRDAVDLDGNSAMDHGTMAGNDS